MLGVPQPAHVSDQRRRECRLHVGTCVSRRWEPANVDSDENDVYDEDHSDSQPTHLSATHPPYMGLAMLNLTISTWQGTCLPQACSRQMVLSQ